MRESVSYHLLSISEVHLCEKKVIIIQSHTVNCRLTFSAVVRILPNPSLYVPLAIYLVLDTQHTKGWNTKNVFSKTPLKMATQKAIFAPAVSPKKQNSLCFFYLPTCYYIPVSPIEAGMFTYIPAGSGCRTVRWMARPELLMRETISLWSI